MGVGLLVAALVVGAGGPAYLRRAVDAAARPAVALGAWIGTGIVVLLMVLAAPVVMHLQPLRGFAPTAAAATACAAVFDTAVGAGWPAAARGVAVALGLSGVVSAVTVVGVALSRSRRSAREHAGALLSLVEATDHVEGVRVWWIADDEPVAYALPGGRSTGTVVASTALRDLGEERCRAVLSHEIAHLSGRHHIAVTAVVALRAAFSPVPLLRWAAAEVCVLVELVADRRAARSVGGPAAVSGALTELGAPAGRVAALAAGRATVRDSAVALVHAVSPAAVVAAAATTAVLTWCSILAG